MWRPKFLLLNQIPYSNLVSGSVYDLGDKKGTNSPEIIVTD